MRLPSWRAVVLGCGAGVLMLWIFFSKIHGVLGATHQVPGAETAVIEGWVADYVMEYAAEAFEEGKYKEVYVTGVPVPRGKHMNGIQTTDEVVVSSLLALGVPSDQIYSMPVEHNIFGDRTLQMAKKLREGLLNMGHTGDFDVLTDGIHGYRSRWVFQNVFPDRKVGVVCLPDNEYDADRWWAYSAGVKKVLMEMISVVYQRLRGIN